MVCPQCRREYPAGALTCPECGVTLAATLPPAPAPTPDVSELVTVSEGFDPTLFLLAQSALQDAGILYVTEGEGRVQSRGESVVTVRPGDVVHTPPDEWHWHGAAPDHFMTHLSLTEGDAAWGEHVSDAEYGAGG